MVARAPMTASRLTSALASSMAASKSSGEASAMRYRGSSAEPSVTPAASAGLTF